MEEEVYEFDQQKGTSQRDNDDGRPSDPAPDFPNDPMQIEINQKTDKINVEIREGDAGEEETDGAKVTQSMPFGQSLQECAMGSPRMQAITTDLETVEKKLMFEKEPKKEEFTCLQQVDQLQQHLFEQIRSCTN